MKDSLPKSPRSIAFRLALRLGFCVFIAPGCGYSLRPPYQKEIKTVYVPMARSITFRKELNTQLTEAVIKEIEQRTPFKVVQDPDGADARLELRIVLDDKNMIVENPQNLPRNLTAAMNVEAKFIPNNAGINSDEITPVIISAVDYFNPEIGEGTLAAFQKVIADIATQLVDMMEAPWDSGPGISQVKKKGGGWYQE